jgi:hypothetical protein
MHTDIRQAHRADLIGWLQCKGEAVKRTGRWWYTEGTDSLRIQGNKWYHNSRGIGGNAIDYLVRYQGFSAREAIWQLSQSKENGGVKEKNKTGGTPTAKSFCFADTSLSFDQRRTLAYLVKTRGIPYKSVISQIQDENLFEETTTGNALFPMKNEYGDIVGAEVAGTMSFYGARFKGVKPGSDLGYGFIVGERCDPQYILYFESAIDLLSFIAISQRMGKSLKSCLLISMAGLRLSVVRNTFCVFGQTTAIPVICTDNDDAGRRFAHQICSIFPCVLVKCPLHNYIDWNDQMLNLHFVKS